jgi:hypothetical protein
MITRYFLLLLPMVVLAIANGTLRQAVFTRHFSDLKAHQLSTVTLIFICTLYVAFVFPSLKIENGLQALLIGGCWVLLTVLFEFSLGRITRRSWSALLQDYNLLTGHIWPLFLLSLFLLPYIFYQLKK